MANWLDDTTAAEAAEMRKFGMIGTKEPPAAPLDLATVGMLSTSAPTVLNEAPRYGSSFSRAVSFTVADHTVLLISGTASINETGQTVHVGDFGAQYWRTVRNIAEILAAEGLSWQHVVFTRCYLRDIERDYAQFNKCRTRFYDWLGLSPYPASVGIQATLCRPDLLVEIEAIAIGRRTT